MWAVCSVRVACSVERDWCDECGLRLFGEVRYNIGMKHEMGLQTRYFNYIKNGTKRIELRLFDEKRKRIRIGDTIEFTNPEGKSLGVKVVGLFEVQIV